MRFADPLIAGRLIRRYKRFMADVELADGRRVTAHCANSGSMRGLCEEGAEVWLSPAQNPKRKLKYTWELVRSGRSLVGINTQHPNALVAEAIERRKIPELAGYAGLRREVRYGRNSRIDILLEDDAKPPCYVEIKNVHFRRQPGLAEFPDAVTARGTKHLAELSDMVKAGRRAVMLYLVQRGDCRRLAIAADIDPDYDAALGRAMAVGVEALTYCCKLSRQRIVVDKAIDGPIASF